MLGGSYKIARIYGIPIRVHLTLLLVLPIMALDFGRALGPGQFLWGVAAAIGLFASIALHELGHSIVAIQKGCRVRDILLLPIGGVAQLESMPTRPKDEFQVAIAGPAVSLALAAIGRSVDGGAAPGGSDPEADGGSGLERLLGFGAARSEEGRAGGDSDAAHESAADSGPREGV